MTEIHLTDKNTLRDRARKNVEDGAVTEGYHANREEILRLLNESLATELVCVLRYKRHYFMANGLKASVAADEFLEHANQEMEHADKLAERIVQLGGEPEFNPDLLSKNAHAQYVAGKTLKEMVYEDLVAERIAVDSYREIIQYIGDKDPTTRRIFEEILAQEEEHADGYRLKTRNGLGHRYMGHFLSDGFASDGAATPHLQPPAISSRSPKPIRVSRTCVLYSLATQ